MAWPASKEETRLASKIREMAFSDLGAAIQLAEDYLKVNPNSIIIRCSLAKSLSVYGNRSEARGHIEKALMLDPENPYALRMMADLDLSALQDNPPNALALLDEAKRCIDKALEQEPAVAQILVTAARVYMQMGEYDTALAHAIKASQTPQKRNSRKSLACLKALFRLGRDNNAYVIACRIIGIPAPARAPLEESQAVLKELDEEIEGKGRYARGKAFSDIVNHSGHPKDRTARRVATNEPDNDGMAL